MCIFIYIQTLYIDLDIDIDIDIDLYTYIHRTQGMLERANAMGTAAGLHQVFK